ncbi:MAG: SGNH/GDSL hydrolase family protein, partial [Ruminococcus sp.]|nr:SGNH/GDSL hydrolase family protein [Ruminococcus sp.]
IKIKKPDTVYIMLGSDMGESPLDEMTASYTSLIANLHSSLPTMKIYIMQYPPTIYDDGEFTNDKINEYNSKLLETANKAGIYCIDTNTALKGENGALDERFWSYEEQKLSSEGYNEIVKYILSHTVS